MKLYSEDRPVYVLKKTFSAILPKIKYFFRCQGAFLFLTLIISLSTTFAYYNNTKEYPRASIFRMLLGTAIFPFKTRLLVYKFSYFVAKLLNANLYYVFFALRWITIILILIVLRSILRELKIKHSLLPFLFPFVTLFSFIDGYWYPTDFLEILFFSLMILLILKDKPFLFSIVFGLSFLNRDSTIFILPFFLYHYIARKKMKELLMYGALLMIIILGIKLLLLPSGTYPLSKEIHQWKLPKNISALKSFPVLWRNPSNAKVRNFFIKIITFSGLLYLLVFFYWKTIPKVIKYFLVIVGPLNLIAGLFVGNLNETRIFYPIIPGLILASAVILERKDRKIRILNILIILIVLIFLAQHGIYLKKECEFSLKSKTFNLQEFKQWKKESFAFQKKDIKFEKDKIIIVPPRIPKTLFFLDSALFISCPSPKPAVCTIWLTKKIKHKSRLKKYGNDFYTLTRNVRFEMKNPSLQSMNIKRIEIQFEDEIDPNTDCEIRWSGFSLKNKT